MCECCVSLLAAKRSDELSVLIVDRMSEDEGPRNVCDVFHHKRDGDISLFCWRKESFIYNPCTDWI
jgi:hypothetical protein